MFTPAVGLARVARTVALVAASAALLGGCSSSRSSAPTSKAGTSDADACALTLACQSSRAAYRQSFPTGVADVRDDGETDVVVTCRTEPSARAAATVPAMTQVLHVRVLWQAGYRVKATMREVSQNAAFHWYVYPAGRADGQGSAAAGQVVEYVGNGLVEVDRDAGGVRVRVTDAKLTPTTVTAGMADPLGPMTLTGTIVGRTDRQRTLAALSDLRATTAAARVTPPEVAAPAVARLPMGP